MRKTWLLAAAAAFTIPAAAGLPQMVVEQLDAVSVAGQRTAPNIARDKYRHPVQTLTFFGVRPNDTVVEIWPGGGYWTEMLAPYLYEKGKLIVATAPGKPAAAIVAKMATNPVVYARVERGFFPSILGGANRVPDGSADKVLTFRNVHNWRMGYLQEQKQDYSLAAFQEMYRMLKPGGVLGVEDHRLPESASDERERTSGYVKVSTVRRLAEQAGFKLAGSSEINANKRDTADWPKGVWTLPPTYADGDYNRARYEAIGESDRMTLKFVKPAR
ncbi:Methyltransferase type 11 [Sphingomonas antarctica]|uniref:class I SAM-dependent methyltransferase n=1 Tax=Sphingomonas antarctica TaxID=2040274 RepID=UPI0039ED6519